MTKEREIEILMKDNCTKAEAEKHLKVGTIIFEDFEENFEKYMEEWKSDEEEVSTFKRMIENKIPAPDWGIVEEDGKTYYIMYAL